MTPEDPVLLPSSAVPTEALPGDAVAAGDEALPQVAVRPGTATADRLCIAGSDAPDPVLYCRQVYRIPPDRVVVVGSFGELMAELARYTRIGELVLYTHGGLSAGEVQLGNAQRTLGQWASGKTSEEGSDPYPGLETWPGSIGSLLVEGCSAGKDPVALLAFLRRVPVTTVEAWSTGRYLDRYVRTVEGDRAALVAQVAATGEFAGAAPWIPKGALGATHTETDIEQALVSTGSFAAFAEIYADDLPFGLTPMAELAVQSPSPIQPHRHFPRAVGLRNRTVIRTGAEAAAAAAVIAAPGAEPVRVVVTK